MTCCQHMDKIDAFTRRFKYYKNKEKNPDLSNVVYFNDSMQFNRKSIVQIQLEENVMSAVSDSNLKRFGLKSPKEWKVHKIAERPGLIYITNPFTPAGQKYWIEECFCNYPHHPNVTNLDGLDKRKGNHRSRDLLNHWKHLRWTTLGYHHNWDTKVYSMDCHTPFPTNLGELTQIFAKMLGVEPFSAEAAIVNYYHLNSTLSGHVDQSEFDLQAPLFSISFGQPAIFLLGGKTKSIDPTAMMVHSGDVIVMSGESRLGYHAVPRILRSDQNSWISDDCIDDSIQWQQLKTYLTKSRINLNVRQVFPQN